MFLCWSTVLPVLPSILHIPSIGELLTNSTRQGWLSGTGRSYLWHHPDSGCPWTWMPMDIPSRFRNQLKITSEVWATTAQRVLNKEISGVKTHLRCMHCIHGGSLFCWICLPFGVLTLLPQPSPIFLMSWISSTKNSSAKYVKTMIPHAISMAPTWYLYGPHYQSMVPPVSPHPYIMIPYILLRELST